MASAPASGGGFDFGGLLRGLGAGKQYLAFMMQKLLRSGALILTTPHSRRWTTLIASARSIFVINLRSSVDLAQIYAILTWKLTREKK